MSARKTFSVTGRRPRLSWLLALALLSLAAPVYGQSLGDVARQERARKQAEPPPADTHVYDNDDLVRSQILLPADRDRAQAAKQQSTPPPTAPVAPPASSDADVNLDPNVDPNTLPLGDIARHYRALKAAARQQQDSQAAARQPMPAAPPLAYPTFTQPRTHILAPVASAPAPLPLHVAGASAATHSTMPTERAHISIPQGAEKIKGTTRFRVQSGDTLWVLARKYLGHGKDWLLLAAHNPQVTDPTHLQVGTWLRLPEAESVASNSAARSSFGPTERVRVQAGDSLWSLSQQRLGNGRAWSCVAQANPELQDANLIFPGQVLSIPGSCSAAASPRAPSPAVSAQSFADPAPR
jgi:nucleoid-associated protein YgaU